MVGRVAVEGIESGKSSAVLLRIMEGVRGRFEGEEIS
jgi:hypothetical protein